MHWSKVKHYEMGINKIYNYHAPPVDSQRNTVLNQVYLDLNMDKIKKKKYDLALGST